MVCLICLIVKEHAGDLGFGKRYNDHATEEHYGTKDDQ